MKLYDSQGNEINTLQRVGNETLNDTRPSTQILAALNAEVFFDIDTQAMAGIDFRGTFVLSAIAEVSFDGTNYFQVPIWNPTTELHIVAISAAGSYQVNIPSGAKRFRIRCSAYTSGSAVVTLRGATIDTFLYAKDIPASMVSNTGAAGAAVTLTIPAAGAGLYNYLVGLYITKFNTALLTAAATPVLVTSTGIIGTPTFSFSAAADIQGTSEKQNFEPIKPIKGTAANAAMTIVGPATTGVIWRINAAFYIGA